MLRLLYSENKCSLCEHPVTVNAVIIGNLLLLITDKA